MTDKINELVEKIDRVLVRLEEIKLENSELKAENRNLKNELSTTRKAYESIRLTDTDRDDKIRTKLVGIMERLNQLESMAG